ncbi:hypothetical protein Tco_0555494 [Tanacetum coccineum]
MESLNYKSQERELHQLQQMQDKAKESCMTSFRLLHSFLQVLSYNELKINGCFERAFATLFEQDVQTFTCSMLLHLDQLEKQLDKDEFQEDRSMAAFWHLDASLVVTECSGTKSDEHITSSSSGTYITYVVDADIRPTNEQVSSVEVHLTAQHNILANEHTDQSEPSYDTYLLEKVDSNTTPDSTNMSHRGGEIDQDAEQDQVKSPLLKAEFLKTNDMVEKEVYNELSNRFLQLEKHCISLEISMQQKEESFQSHKPCKNQESPEFREFFEINDLKAQLQAKTTLICNLKNQIKSVKEASNEAKLKKEINVLETINIELESSVAKLLAENEKLNKENEHLKQTYKELYDSIKKTRIQTKDHNDSLIAQVNSKTVENADLKAQIQEKVFANAALKNELRKLNETSVDTKFAKPSILGKPVLQPHRNQSVVRQPNAFKSERPNFSKPQFASQVDVINVLSKPVTPHYLPISSRNSQEEYYGSNDMAHNHYLEEARKKTQERNRNSKSSVMPYVRLQNTANGSTPNPKRTSQTSRSLPTSKNSCITITVVPKADHSRNSSSFLDSKHFFCSTSHKCVFNANHDACITKLLNEVNSRKVKPHKTKNSNNLVEQKKSYSETWWISTGRIFKLAGLRWIPTRKMFIDSTTKVDSEPPNGSNEDITNPYECDQTLNVSACTLNLSADNTSGPAPRRKEKCTIQCALSSKEEKYSLLQTSPNVDHPVLEVPTVSRFLLLQLVHLHHNCCQDAKHPVDKQAPHKTLRTTSSVIPQDQIDVMNPEGNRLVLNLSKPLPLRGPPGQERRHALLISKLKAAYYPDFRLKELLPSLWIESEHVYDISVAYVRSHMRILSVVSLKTYSRYGYTYFREIVLHRADYKEYKISEADFKNLHPNDFEDLYLLNLQGNLNHLSGDDKVHLSNAVTFYQTKLNLTQPSWDATNFLFKEDYTIVHKPRAIIFRDRNNQKKMMQEILVHKFSDGTLTRILENLDYMVKDYELFKFNPGMERIIWTEDDKRRSQEFIRLIETRLKIRRICRSLECFMSGRFRDIDYRLITRTK